MDTGNITEWDANNRKTLSKRHITGLNNTNNLLKNFTAEIQNEIQSLAHEYSIALNNWGFDPINNEINIYADSIDNESTTKDFQGKQIGNFTIHSVNSTIIMNSEAEVRKQLTELTEPQKGKESVSYIEYYFGIAVLFVDYSCCFVGFLRSLKSSHFRKKDSNQ